MYSQDHVFTTDDTSSYRTFRRVDILPAISSSPETSLTLGVIGIKYFDLSRGDLSTPISNMEFLAIYTLNNQLIIETSWELFTHKNNWRLYGKAFYERFPDRNYGLGNDAAAQVVTIENKEAPDTLNYLHFNSDRIHFSPVILRKIRPNLFFGLQYDMESLYGMEIIPDHFQLINAHSTTINNMPIEGVRSGLGFQLLFDDRDRTLNPLKGNFIRLNNINYGGILGSDYTFSTFYLDSRQYLNTTKNQTLALRSYASVKLTNDEIPMRALSRIGGDDFIRGYYRGTYQDHHMLAFEAEYRLPFWPEGTTARLWQVWKRLGIVVFISGAQVFHEASELRFNDFNLAVGGGLRILINPQSRVNLRIDYAIGLRQGSDGIDKRQSGLYFNLGEAF